MDSVKEDMEAQKLTVQQAMVLVWDRNKWKHQVAASSSLEWRKRAEKKKKKRRCIDLLWFIVFQDYWIEQIHPMIQLLCTAAAGALLRGRQPAVGQTGDGDTSSGQRHQDVLQFRERRAPHVVVSSDHTNRSLWRSPRAVRSATAGPASAQVHWYLT